MQGMTRLKAHFARYTRRQLLILKLAALVLLVILAMPPWETCVQIWGGSCIPGSPYGWDFILTVVSDDHKMINFFLLFLEIAAVTAVGSYLMDRFGAKPRSIPSQGGKTVYAWIGRSLTIFFGLIAVFLIVMIVLALFRD